jgi:AraC family transcriptional regulator
MQEELLGELSLPGGLVEVRQYVWHEPELLTFRLDHFMLSCLVTRASGSRPFGWHLPCASQALSAAQMSVVPPRSPVTVAFDKGKAIIVSCILAPEYFERVTGINDWSERHTLLCLGLRSRLIGLIFNRLTHEVHLARCGSPRVAEAFIGALAAEVARGIERSMGERSLGELAPWQLYHVYRMLEEETEGCRLTIEQIARRCGLSSRHLMRAFKATTGLTVHQYASEVRMRRAMTLLTDSDMPLKVLSGRLGFNSASAFSAAFRKDAGCTPSQFRRALRR